MMSAINRRSWIKKSLLASSIPLVGGVKAYREIFPWQSAGVDARNGVLRLNWNENPYGPPASAHKAMVEAFTGCNLYPDDLIAELKDKLAEKNGLKKEQLLLTAGSTEILSLLGQHVALEKGEILSPWPSFPTLLRFGERHGASTRTVPLDDDTIDLKKLADAIAPETKLIFICNPNNPTSTEIPKKHLYKFLQKVPANILVCVDEAYIEYSKLASENSTIPFVEEFENLVVCRTFSKAYGLAGLRIGYAVSSQANIEALRDRHAGWELSTGIVTVGAVLAALDDNTFLDYVVLQNREGKGIMYNAFQQWGVDYSHSSTNFIYVKSEKFDPEIVDKLKGENILISKWPDMTHHVRISVGKPAEMKVLVKAMEKYLI